VLNIGKVFVKKSLPGKVLKLYANFIQANKFNESFLLQISKVLLQKEFDKNRSQADKLLIPKLCNPFKKSQIHPPKSVNS